MRQPDSASTSGTLLGDIFAGVSSSYRKVVQQGRHFSASSASDAPRITVVLQGRQFSASSSTDCSAYSSCVAKSPVLSFHIFRLLRVFKLCYKIASSQLPDPQIAPRTAVVLQSRQFSASRSPDCSAHSSCATKSPVLSFQLHRLLRVQWASASEVTGIGAVSNRLARHSATAASRSVENVAVILGGASGSGSGTMGWRKKGEATRQLRVLRGAAGGKVIVTSSHLPAPRYPAH